MNALTALADPELNRRLAATPATPVPVLEHLTTHAQTDIRNRANQTLEIQVLQNRALPSRLLERLATRRDQTLQFNIARHPQTPAIVLRDLGHAGDWAIRWAVAHHPPTPGDLLEQLSVDPQWQVRESALMYLHKNHPQEVNYPDSLLAQLHVANAKQTPVKQLQRLATSSWQQVRAAVARHPQTSPVTLAQLVADPVPADPVPQVQLGVADNTRTPIAVLEQLACIQEQHYPIREMAIRNWMIQQPEQDCPLLATDAILAEPSFSRAMIFLHPQVPPSLLIEHQASIYWLERYAIAQNPHTPMTALEHLAQDGTAQFWAGSPTVRSGRELSSANSCQGNLINANPQAITSAVKD